LQIADNSSWCKPFLTRPDFELLAHWRSSQVSFWLPGVLPPKIYLFRWGWRSRYHTW